MIDVESLLRMQVERLAPLPEPRSQDWPDVLRRAGHRRRRARGVVALVAVAGVLSAALLVAGPALGLRPSIFGDEPTPTWTWPEGVPGEAVKPPKLLLSINQSANGRWADRVDLSTVRQIVSVGTGYEKGAYFAARGVNGDVCLAKMSGYAGSGFTCLHDLPKPGVSPIDDQAVLIGSSAGGHRGSVVDYSTLIGVTRADVGRVELELADGATIELPLNRWRGFAYYATDRKRFPKTLSVYATWTSFFRHHEKLVGQLPVQQIGGLEPSPLCGGKYGPCPPGVKP
jgi:hypothetical protein